MELITILNRCHRFPTPLSPTGGLTEFIGEAGQLQVLGSLVPIVPSPDGK